MRKQILNRAGVIAISVLIAFSAYGQDTKTDTKLNENVISLSEKKTTRKASSIAKTNKHAVKTANAETKQVSAVFDATKDYLVLSGGRVYWKKDNTFTLLDRPVVVHEMKISPEGKVDKSDSTHLFLKEGEALTVTGNVVKANSELLTQERIKLVINMLNSLERHNQELENNVLLLNEKVRLLDKKSSLMNQKMILIKEKSNPKLTREAAINNEEDLSAIDQAIRDVETDIHDLDKRMIRKGDK